mmetsp:Transcript_17759/g.27877  ORF Transcript_17759/g.27877 Transcript_17759/m.27877 type:complete len:295 (-) Transcript_17759:906-1790(-)
MNLAVRIVAAILSVPPDVIAPIVPMMAPSPRNILEVQLRNEVNTILSGRCSAAEVAPLFAISNEEANFVDCDSGLPGVMDVYKSDDDEDTASTYGEITMLGARQLFYYMSLTTQKSRSNNKDFHFYDLGSGGGRLVIQSYLELPSVSTSVGIELSHSRHEIASKTYKYLQDNGDITRIRNLARRAWGIEDKDDTNDSGIKLYEGDLFKLDISKATHIYVSSLCFSEQMLEMLVEKIEREATSLQVIASLRMLPLKKNNDEALVKIGKSPWQEWIEMSWSKEGSSVYIYAVESNI